MSICLSHIYVNIKCRGGNYIPLLQIRQYVRILRSLYNINTKTLLWAAFVSIGKCLLQLSPLIMYTVTVFIEHGRIVYHSIVSCYYFLNPRGQHYSWWMWLPWHISNKRHWSKYRNTVLSVVTDLSGVKVI